MDNRSTTSGNSNAFSTVGKEDSLKPNKRTWSYHLSDASFGLQAPPDDDMDLTLNTWARNRLSNLGTDASKTIQIDDPAFDPLTFTVIKYVNMPLSKDKQCPTRVVHNQFALTYKQACRQKGGPLKLYKPLLAKKVSDLPDSCKLLVSDLRLFFSSRPAENTMSLCVLPSIMQNKHLLRVEFFQDILWRERVMHDIRKIPKKADYEFIEILVKSQPVSRAPPFNKESLQKTKLEIEQSLDECSECIARALDVTRPDDDNRMNHIKQAERCLIRAAACISNITDVGLDGLGGYKEVSEEKRDPVSWQTMQTMGNFAAEIRRKLNIDIPFDPYTQPQENTN
jgi:hypothetical protein